MSKPFWGKSCKVKNCCEKREHEHCGECETFPCKKLKDFAFDKEQGDDGKRIERCKEWRLDGKPLKEQLAMKRFDYVSQKDKEFILAFDGEMQKLGYCHGENIGSGYCWGRHMIIFSKSGGKTPKVIARIYIRDTEVKIWGGKEYRFSNGIVLRLFLTEIDKHLKYVETAPAHIKDRFISDDGMCRYCEGSVKCHNRKTYTIDRREYVKCGYIFSFKDPNIADIKDYVECLAEFFVKRIEKKIKNDTWR